MSLATEPRDERDAMNKARRSLGIFCLLLVPACAWLEWRLIAGGVRTAVAGQRVTWLMCAPALCSFVARIVNREGFEDVSFRFGGWRGQRIAILAIGYSLAIHVVAYGIAWVFGLAAFEP